MRHLRTAKATTTVAVADGGRQRADLFRDAARLVFVRPLRTATATTTATAYLLPFAPIFSTGIGWKPRAKAGDVGFSL
jgi:hypothetical protein